MIKFNLKFIVIFSLIPIVFHVLSCTPDNFSTTKEHTVGLADGDTKTLIEKSALEVKTFEQFQNQYRVITGQSLPIIYDVKNFTKQSYDLYGFFRRKNVAYQEKIKFMEQNIVHSVSSAKIFIIDLFFHLLNNVQDLDFYKIQTSLHSLGKISLRNFLESSYLQKESYFKDEVKLIYDLSYYTIDAYRRKSMKKNMYFIADGLIFDEDKMSKEYNLYNKDIRQIISDKKIDDFILNQNNETKNTLKVLELFKNQRLKVDFKQVDNFFYLSKKQITEYATKLLKKNFDFYHKTLLEEFIADVAKAQSDVAINYEIRRALEIHHRHLEIGQENEPKAQDLNFQKNRQVPLYLMGNHSQAYISWRMAKWNFGIADESCTLLHIDTHADISVKSYTGLQKTIEEIEKHKNNYQYIARLADDEFKISGFISPAVYKKIFSTVYWVLPPYAKPGSDHHLAFFNLEKKSDHVDSILDKFGLYLIDFNSDFVVQKTYGIDAFTAKSQQPHSAFFIKTFAEALPSFENNDCVYLDIDLDFFNNSGYDTSHAVKANYSDRQARQSVENLFISLKNARLQPVTVNIADSPIYTQGSQIQMLRKHTIEMLKKHLPADYKIIQLQEAYHPQILYSLLALKQHLTVLRKNQNVASVELYFRRFPTDWINGGGYKTLDEEYVSPWVYLPKDYYNYRYQKKTGAYDFSYFFDVLKQIPTEFLLNRQPTNLPTQLNQLMVLLKNKSPKALPAIEALATTIEKILHQHRYAFEE